MIDYFGEHYFDDRMFILEVSEVTVKNFELTEEKQEWSVITRKNSPGYYPTRTNDFSTEKEAIEFFKQILPITPLVSQQGRSLGTDITYDAFIRYCEEKNIDIELY